MKEWMNTSALGDLGITSYIFCDHTNGVRSKGGNKMKYSACSLYTQWFSVEFPFFFFLICISIEVRSSILYR